MHRVPPLDLHGSNIDGATNPLRRSRGDPSGGASREGGWTDAAVPAVGEPPPRASGDSGRRMGAWAAAVAEAEAEAEAEAQPVVRGPVPGEPTSDPVADGLSCGELSHEMLQTLMRMQGSHEAARERRRVRTASTDGAASAAHFPAAHFPPSAAQPETASPAAVEAPAETGNSPQSEEIRPPADRPPLRYAADPTPTNVHEAIASFPGLSVPPLPYAADPSPSNIDEAVASFPGLSLQSMEAEASMSSLEDSDAGSTSD